MNSRLKIFSAVMLVSSLSFAQTKAVIPSAPVDEDTAPVKTEAKAGVKIYTLAQAIEQAIRVSPMITSAQYELEFSKAQLQEANGAMVLPSIEVRTLGGLVPDIPQGSGPEANFPNVNTGIEHIGPFVQAQVEAYQPIYTFGRIKNLREAARKGVEARTEGVDKSRNDLVLLVKKAYVGLTSLYSFKEFIEDIQGRAESAKTVVEKEIQKKKSSVTDIDLMRIQVFQAETDRRLIEINNGINFTLMALKVLMGLPRDANIDIADRRSRMDDTVIAPVDNYLQIAKEHRPEIIQLQNLVDVREATMNVAKASFYPTFGIAGFYRYGYAPDRQHVDNPFLVDNFNYNTGGGFLVLTQSFSFHMTKARFKQAKATYEKTIADQQRALQGIEVEIRKAHNNAISKQQAVEAATRGFKSGRSWVLAASLNFGVGVTPPKELLEAFVGYSTVKINYLQTLNDYFLSLADLSNAVGQEVTNLKY